MIRTEELLLNVGPQHPSTHGVFRIIVKLDGEVITEATPVMGYLHRGTEKLAENLNYTQIIPYTDRMDYVSAMTNNYVLCHAVEKMMGLEVPERAEFMRLIVMELQRIASHLVWWGTYLLDIGAMSPFLYRVPRPGNHYQSVQRAMRRRLTYNYMRVGGVKWDAPEGWIEQGARIRSVHGRQAGRIPQPRQRQRDFPCPDQGRRANTMPRRRSTYG